MDGTALADSVGTLGTTVLHSVAVDTMPAMPMDITTDLITGSTTIMSIIMADTTEVEMEDLRLLAQREERKVRDL